MSSVHFKYPTSGSQRSLQRGLTLVELMVAMAISLFMLLAIALVYSSSKTGFVYANNTVHMSEDASFAIDSLSRDIRMAAYAGCAGTVQPRTAGVDTVLYTADDVFDDPTVNTPTPTPSKPKLFNVTGLTGTYVDPNPFTSLNTDPKGPFAGALTSRNAVMGFPSGTGVAANAARTALHPTASTSYTVSTTAPMLYLAGGAAKAYQVSAAVVAGQANATLAGTPYVGPKFLANAFMLIADCQGAEVFRLNSDMNGTTGAMTNEKTFLNPYSSDAIITPLETSTYFLAKRNGATNSSLYKRSFNGRAATFDELVPNVEAITFQYGENTTPNATTAKPSFVADIYRSDASAVTDWSRVVSIRMGLILVSEDANQGPSNDTSIEWVGGTYTPASTTDRRLRRAYSTTVSIRNRMGL